MLLFSFAKGTNNDGIAFAIADQVNYDIGQLEFESPEVRIDIAKINLLAGLKARDCSDHVRSRSYFTCAMSLLPTDRWERHYEISLQLSFLLAKSAYKCGDQETAEGILTEIIKESRCVEDKLPASYLLATSKYS